MTQEEFRAAVLFGLVLVLVCVAALLIRVITNGGLEFQIRRVEERVSDVSDDLASAKTEMAVLRTEVRAVANGLGRVEHMLSLIFEASIGKGEKT
jgi:hypothetical protein